MKMSRAVISIGLRVVTSTDFPVVVVVLLLLEGADGWEVVPDISVRTSFDGRSPWYVFALFARTRAFCVMFRMCL